MAAFIAGKWTEREVARFYDLLAAFERHVALFPLTYPRSQGFDGCRTAIIHRNAAVVYRIDGDVIHIVTIVDNRSSKPR